jgi:long-subunit fatty acid transport protein
MGWAIGMLIDPTEWMSIGLSYMVTQGPRFRGDIELHSTRVPEADLTQEFGTFGYALPYGLEVEMPIPPAIGVGVNFTPLDWFEFGIDFRLWLYTMYTYQALRPLYRDDAPPNRPMTEESLSREKDYDLSYELSLGLLFRPIRGPRPLELMMGIGYDRSPVPDESFAMDNPSMSQIVASAGVRWQLHRNVRMSAAYMLLVYLERDITTSQTSPPTNVRGGGFAHIPSLELEVAF